MQEAELYSRILSSDGQYCDRCFTVCVCVCVQYHEVISFLCGRFLGAVTVFFVMLNVFGISVAQVIACSSDAYYWRTSLSKRYSSFTAFTLL